MFSRTTIASSITMPTESVSASIVIELSVKPMYQMRPNVAMIDVGMAMAAMIVERMFMRNSSTTRAGGEAQRRGTRVDAPAGNPRVLRLQGARDIGDGDVVGAQPIRVQPHVHLTLAPAEDQDLTDAVDAFELAPQHLVGVLRDVAD